MNVTAITCTHNRPAALDLCRPMLNGQTRRPEQWLLLDGPEPMRLKVLRAIEENAIEGEAVVFFEDDDYFRSDWIEWVVGRLEAGYDVAGEGNAAYYHVGNRWWSECGNKRHAALCQTAVTSDVLPFIANVIKSYDSPFFDTRLWEFGGGKTLALPKDPSERRVVGIKGIKGEGGATGYSGEHRQIMPEGTHADPSLLQLWKWIGSDAGNYSKFWNL